MNPHSQNTPITSSSPQSFSYTYWEEDDEVGSGWGACDFFKINKRKK